MRTRQRLEDLIKDVQPAYTFMPHAHMEVKIQRVVVKRALIVSAIGVFFELRFMDVFGVGQSSKWNFISLITKFNGINLI